MGAPHRSRPCGLRRVSRRNLAPDAACGGAAIRCDMVAGLRPATADARLRPRGAHLRAFRVCQGRRGRASLAAMLTLDISSLEKALAAVQSATKRPLADSLNRAALHVIIGSGAGPGAMRLTPVAKKEKIKADLSRSMGGKKASEGVKIYRNQYGTFSRRSSRSKGAAGDSLLKYIALSRLKKRGIARPTGEQIQALMNKILASRLAATGYTAFAGWHKAATALGGRGVRGVDPKRFGQSEARHGSASKATANDLAATIINTAPQAEEIGSEALQQAVENAAQDLLNYAQKKLMEQARKAGF